jgi:ribonuclease BN (tRNA processing enzyme)
MRVVGCSGSVPGPASAASCYLVEAEAADGRTWRVALDLGSGALGALQRWCDPRELDAVALSHLHPDHCADLAALHAYLGHHPDGPSEPVAVLAPFGAASRAEQLRGSANPSPYLDFRAWQAGAPVRVGPLTLTPHAVVHSVPAYALRVEGPAEAASDGATGVTLAYSGDADVCDGLALAAHDADLLLCEATYLEGGGEGPGVHLTGRRAGEVAREAGARSLLLTHVPPWTDPNAVLAEAHAVFYGQLALAQPGALHSC